MEKSQNVGTKSVFTPLIIHLDEYLCYDPTFDSKIKK